MAFNHILKQEIAWFDDRKNGTGTLCSRLSSDAAAIQGVMHFLFDNAFNVINFCFNVGYRTKNRYSSFIYFNHCAERRYRCLL